MRPYRWLADQFSAPARQRARMLHDHPAPGNNGLSPGELAVLAVVNSSKTKRDIRAGRRLLRAQRALSRSAGHAAGARLRVRQLERYLPDDERRRTTLRRFEDDDLRQLPTHTNRLIARGLLSTAEVLFVVIEFAFWYHEFTLDVDSTDTAGHVSAGLIALAIPLVGILTARITGGLCHRWWRGHEKPGLPTYIAAAAALILMLFTVIAIGWLVLWRFNSPTDTALSIDHPMPAKPLAAIFIALIVGDALARTFLASEVHSQKDSLRRTVTNAERRHRRAARRVQRADDRHQAAWLRLQHRTSIVIDHAARLHEVGSVLVLDHRTGATQGSASPTPWFDVFSTSVHTPSTWDANSSNGATGNGQHANGRTPTYPSPLLLPYVTLPDFADKNATQVGDPTLRRAADAIATLIAHPPAGTGTPDQVVDALGPLFGRDHTRSAEAGPLTPLSQQTLDLRPQAESDDPHGEAR